MSSETPIYDELLERFSDMGLATEAPESDHQEAEPPSITWPAASP